MVDLFLLYGSSITTLFSSIPHFLGFIMLIAAMAILTYFFDSQRRQ